MFKINRPATSMAVIQLFDVLDKVNEEMWCKKNVEVDLMGEVHEIVEEFQDSFLNDC